MTRETINVWKRHFTKTVLPSLDLQDATASTTHEDVVARAAITARLADVNPASNLQQFTALLVKVGAAKLHLNILQEEALYKIAKHALDPKSE